ncbi:MAG: hypothetical protein ACI4RA_08795 [Kiritimatiellia bacterium]
MRRGLRAGLRVLCGCAGTLLAAVCPRPASAAPAAEPVVGCVEVATRAPHNPRVKVWYRAPRRYDPDRPGRWRVLVLFGGRNCDGRPEVSGKLGWPAWADLNGVFLVAPTLKDDAYWDPKAWSGRALLDALAALGAKYRVAQSGLLCYGYSAGSQAANLFPAWRPDLFRAYVSHACGVFHRPSAKMRDVAGLVTCGDADAARYVLGRRFVAACRELGVPVVWKSFPNHPHDVPPGSVRLAKAFLAHGHWSRPADLGLPAGAEGPSARFVGDDADGLYYPAGSAAAAAVMPDDRVDLPCETVAAAWGRPGRAEGGGAGGRTYAETFGGVEVVFAVPGSVRADSRVLVLVGGRGWTGGRAVRDLGFAPWAGERNWCIVAPSFSRGEYWVPSNGAADVLRRAVDALRRRHGVRPLPVFLFGYSAGGQLVALLQDDPPFPVAAWGVSGCGVFPDEPRAGAPAFVACGVEDAGRLEIGRDFAYRYREAGGLLLWHPAKGAHGPDAGALRLSRAYFAAVASGAPCALWGEDDTRRVLPRARIDAEFLNPLHNREIAGLWR